MAHLGHEVVGYDVDVAKVNSLNSGKAPFFEPGLDDLLQQGLKAERLEFTDDPSKLAQAAVHFICVGTPQKRAEYAADLTYVDAAVKTLAMHLQPGSLVVGKSTVPVGTGERLLELIRTSEPGATLVWNPE